MRSFSLPALFAAMALTAAPVIWAADAETAKFLTEAIQGNLGEIKVGALAQQKGTSEAVKAFGAMLEKDHSAANQKAIKIAKSMGITPPTKPGPEQTTVYQSLSKASGAEFDRLFAESMVEDHRKDIAEYQKQTQQSQGEVSQYARETLTDLQMHMQAALSLQGKSPQPATLPPTNTGNPR